MKYALSLFLAGVLISCSNNNESSVEGGGAPNMTNIENVNGNMPDTSNGSSLNTPMEVDSSKADTTRQ